MSDNTALQQLAMSSAEFTAAIAAVEQMAMALHRQEQPGGQWASIGSMRGMYRQQAARLLLEHKDQL